MLVCETFRSIQGESTRAGMVSAFVRLTGCNLNCTYCDTGYAREQGEELPIGRIVDRIRALDCPLVEVTGGEPLLQRDTPRLCAKLLSQGYTVLLETNGTQDISVLPDGCIRIVDIKCPGSGHEHSFLKTNLDHLRPSDECKLVISDRADFEWAVRFVKEHELDGLCAVIFSPNADKLGLTDLADWILDLRVPVRLGLQLHKLIWGDKATAGPECRQ